MDLLTFWENNIKKLTADWQKPSNHSKRNLHSAILHEKLQSSHWATQSERPARLSRMRRDFNSRPPSWGFLILRAISSAARRIAKEEEREREEGKDQQRLIDGLSTWLHCIIAAALHRLRHSARAGIASSAAEIQVATWNSRRAKQMWRCRAVAERLLNRFQIDRADGARKGLSAFFHGGVDGDFDVGSD